MPLVSIIVPVYNTEKYLSECLDCLINQTYKDIEIICINDGSTDNSLKILEEYQKKDNRIKIFSRENSGEAATRNRGIELVQGDYIAALDSDDTCSLNSIETCVEVATKNDADIVIHFLNIRQNQLNRDVKEFSYFGATQLFVRKELLLNNPDIKYNANIKMGPDSVFSHKLLGTTDKIATNPSSVYFYRRHENQISRRIEDEPEKLLENIRLWFEDLTEFYTRRDWWISHNNHFMNYLCEQPFTSYLRANWTKEQKEELFNLIHNTIKGYGLKANFDYTNKRVEMFKKFLKCKNYKQFEFYWWISHLYTKFTDFQKQHHKG